MIIAVDGSAASGKGTLAKRLAAHYDLAHLDTGALYRYLALQADHGRADRLAVTESDAAGAMDGIDLSMAGAAAIRTDAVAGMASVVAAMPAVRQNFVSLQTPVCNPDPGPSRRRSGWP